MVVVVLMVLFLGVLSVGIWAYARSLLTDAAGQAARFAANADVLDPAVASSRTAEIMAGTLFGGAADSVSCVTAAEPAATMVEVRCTMASPFEIPLLGDLIPEVTATAHVLRERP